MMMGDGVAAGAQFVDFAHDGLKRGFAGIRLVLPAGRQLAAGKQSFQCNPAGGWIRGG